MTVSDEDKIAYMALLRELEIDGERVDVAIGPYTAMLVIGALQLATRHPEMGSFARGELDNLARSFLPWFEGTIGAEIILAGFDPAQDR